MKKILKKILIFIIILLILFALFIVAWVYVILPNFILKEGEAAETEPGLTELAKESEKVDFNESNGLFYINNEIIVFINPSAAQEEIDELFDDFDADAEESMADIFVYKLMFEDAMTYDDLEALIKKIKSDTIVEDAYLNTVNEFTADAAGEEDDFEYQDPLYPDDPWNGDSWDQEVPNGENWGMEAIDAPGAWGYLDQLSSVKIGLIDTMPNADHEDLSLSASNCLFVDESTGKAIEDKYFLSAEDHGTHVAGTMNAVWDNGTGVSGVMGGKGELYYGITYFESDGVITSSCTTAYGYLLTLKSLIDQDVQVINISQHTGRLIGFAASHGNQNAINYLARQADLTEKGLLRIISDREAAGKPDFVICVSAGNSNHTYYYQDDKQTYGYREEMTSWEAIKYMFGWRGERGDSLALYNNFLNLMDEDAVKDRVIVVGAVGIDADTPTSDSTQYSYADFSNVGSRVDVVAPGVDVYSCIAKGYGYKSGTSMAAPHVSGVAGLIFASNPDLSGPEVKDILLASTTGRYYHGGEYSGLLNANNSVVNALKTVGTPVKRVLQTESYDGLDLCFVVDTTGSMGDDIDNAKENMADILEHLAEKTKNYRVALIDYRDFSSRSGNSQDYPYKVQLRFTNNNDAITEAINGLDLGHGGDEEETVYSALMAAADLDWRSGAKKVIIILGDAAPLNPEPVTNYTYEDVLLALLFVGIDIDYENSDSRVVDAFDYNLINVFSIGTDASADAADFFKEISAGTGGSYVGVDDASKVGDAIIESIEQIEVAELLSVHVDFGSDMANQRINLYRDSEFLFSFETDNNGRFTIDSMEPDIYKWTSNNLNGGGSIEIESNERKAVVSTTKVYWFAPMLVVWHQYNRQISAILAIYIAVCVAVPLMIKHTRKRILHKKMIYSSRADLAPTGTDQNNGAYFCCPNCGTVMNPDALFCIKCGYQRQPVFENAAGRICQNCGNVCAEGELYCGECGTKVESE